MSETSPRRFERPDLAWTCVTGDDRIRFLHALMTGDVEGLAVGRGGRNLLLTDKGKLTADCILLVEEEQVLLGCDARAREGLLAALDHYLVADDVELEPLELRSHQLLGKGALPELSSPEGELSHTQLGELRLIRHGLGATPGWLLLSEGDPGEGLGELPVGEPGELEALRIAAGEPAWGSELSAGIFPQEVGLEGCLHALKGCYLGQETMVRIATQGHVNWQLAGLRLEGAAARAGDAIHAPDDPGKKLGTITSAALLPGSEQPVALARLRHEQAEFGTVLTVATDTAEVAATVVELPFAY